MNAGAIARSNVTYCPMNIMPLEKYLGEKRKKREYIPIFGCHLFAHETRAFCTGLTTFATTWEAKPHHTRRSNAIAMGKCV